MTDSLLISFCLAIMSEQEILVQAFKNFGHEDNSQTCKTQKKVFFEI